MMTLRMNIYLWKTKAGAVHDLLWTSRSVAETNGILAASSFLGGAEPSTDSTSFLHFDWMSGWRASRSIAQVSVVLLVSETAKSGDLVFSTRETPSYLPEPA